MMLHARLTGASPYQTGHNVTISRQTLADEWGSDLWGRC